MSFKEESIEAFDAMLEEMRDSNPDACSARYPVTRAGIDKTGADDYDCIPSPSPDKMDLQDGGFLNSYEYSMACRQDDFDSAPISGDLFKRNGKVSRVLWTEPGELSGLLILHMGTPER